MKDISWPRSLMLHKGLGKELSLYLIYKTSVKGYVPKTCSIPCFTTIMTPNFWWQQICTAAGSFTNMKVYILNNPLKIPLKHLIFWNSFYVRCMMNKQSLFYIFQSFRWGSRGRRRRQWWWERGIFIKRDENAVLKHLELRTNSHCLSLHIAIH